MPPLRAAEPRALPRRRAHLEWRRAAHRGVRSLPLRRRPAVLKRLVRILLAVVLGLAVSELALRAAGSALLSAGGQRAADGGSAERFLCLGDSNTYGLYLEGPDSYPAKLDALIRAHAGATATVINLGVPGQGVHHVREGLPAHLERYAPKAVLVLAGVNNTWSSSGGRTTAFGRWVSDMRLVKLARLVTERFTGRGGADAGAGAAASAAAPSPNAAPASSAAAKPAIGAQDQMDLAEFMARGEETADGIVHRVRTRSGEEVVYLQEQRALEGQQYLDAISGGLDAIVDLCEGAGARAVLLTYPMDTPVTARINTAVRAVAARRGAVLVDLEREFRPYLAAGLTEALLFPDLHPRANATEIMARVCLRELLRAGLVQGEAQALPSVQEIQSGYRPPQRALSWQNGKLGIEGSHGESGAVFLSTAAGELAFHGMKTQLGASALLLASRERKDLGFTIGPSGRAEVAIPAEWLKSCSERGLELRAVALYSPQNLHGQWDNVSNTLVIEPLR
ncbi:MAG: hypothetical protein EPO68_03655 [Planctomycetota bacterium]|nr:MAG: hypothetical protein EPO68_03655 [Planctomycetota bacterium]